MEKLEQKIESVLFFKGEPMSKKDLAEFFKVNLGDLDASIEQLRKALEGRGIVLLENGDEISLGTSSEFSELITQLQKSELQKDLSKANLS